MHWSAGRCAIVHEASFEPARVQHENSFRLPFFLFFSFPLRAPLHGTLPLQYTATSICWRVLSAVKLRHVEIMVIARRDGRRKRRNASVNLCISACMIKSELREAEDCFSRTSVLSLEFYFGRRCTTECQVISLCWKTRKKTFPRFSREQIYLV